MNQNGVVAVNNEERENKGSQKEEEEIVCLDASFFANDE